MVLNCALVAPLRLFSGDIEAAESKTQLVDQFMDTAAVADGRQILVHDGLSLEPWEKRPLALAAKAA